MKSLKVLQTRLFISLCRTHCSETLQWRCYNTAVIVFLTVNAMLLVIWYVL